MALRYHQPTAVGCTVNKSNATIFARGNIIVARRVSPAGSVGASALRQRSPLAIRTPSRFVPRRGDRTRMRLIPRRRDDKKPSLYKETGLRCTEPGYPPAHRRIPASLRKTAGVSRATGSSPECLRKLRFAGGIYNAGRRPRNSPHGGEYHPRSGYHRPKADITRSAGTNITARRSLALKRHAFSSAYLPSIYLFWVRCLFISFASF